MYNAETLQEYLELKSEAGSLITDLGTSLISLVEGPSDTSAECVEAHKAIDGQLQSFWGRFYQLKKRHERQQLSVAVLALTKSGKSTLINAFLGNEVLPVNNVPETARISRITHSPSASCPEPTLEIKDLKPAGSSSPSALSPAASANPFDLARTASGYSSSSADSAGTVLTGAQEIREYLQQLNRDVRSREHLRSDDQVLDITAPLVVLDAPGTQDYAGIKMCLLDTPGPNEAGEEGLKYQVERLLDRVDAAIYLLDYTKLKTSEEAQVLERLKSINPSLVARLSSRLFFAVNKMDQADESIGLDEEETREYVAEMVTRQLNCPDFKLHPDQVLLLSARNALLSRLVLAGRADPANTQRFSRIAFGSFNPRSSNGGRSTELLHAAAEDMLQGSGVPELEERVLGFLFEAAAGVKLMAVLDDAGRLLTEVSNVAASCRGALAASSARLTASTAALQSELSATLGRFDGVMEGTTDLQVEVVDELRAHLGNLRTRLFQYILSSLDIEALSHERTAAAAAEAGGSGGSSGCGEHHHRRRHHHRSGCHSRHRHHRHGYGHEQQQQQGHCSSSSATAAAGGVGADYSSSNEGSSSCFSDPELAAAAGDGAAAGVAAAAAAAAAGSGRGWWRLRQRFLRMFSSWMAGGTGGCESKDELSSALMDLSEDIMSQVQGEVADTWAVMERATNARAGRLVTSLNAALEQLSARLEGVVNDGLQIRLEPVSLHMTPPDAVSFHADLTELIDKGIAAEQARHVRACERTEMVWEARRGVCRLTQYYVQVPRRRRIVETYTATTYSLVPSAVAEHFMGVVDKAISETERALAGYVKEYVRRQVAAARDKVQEYGDRYLDSMGAALEAASQGADARAAALAQVESYCSTLESLRARLTELQARAELLVPHNSGSGCGVFEQVDYVISEAAEEETGGEEGQAAEAEVEATAEATAAGAVEEAPCELQQQQVQEGAGVREVPHTAEGTVAAADGAVQAAAMANAVLESDEAEDAAVEYSQLQEQQQQLEVLVDMGQGSSSDVTKVESVAVAPAVAAAVGDTTAAAMDAADAGYPAVSRTPYEEEEEEEQQQQQAEEVTVGASGAEEAAAAAEPLSRVGSSSSSSSGGGGSLSGGSSSSSSSSAQLLSLAEVEEAQQAEAAAAGQLLMASLPSQQQQQQPEVTVAAGVDAAVAAEGVDVAGSSTAASAPSSSAAVAAAAERDEPAAAAAEEDEAVPALLDADSAAAAGGGITIDDILGGLPMVTAAAKASTLAAAPAAEPQLQQSKELPAAAEAATSSAAGPNSALGGVDDFVVDIDAIEGAQLLWDASVPVAAVAPVQPAALLPPVAVAAAAEEQHVVAAATGGSPAGSTVSNAETAVSDTFSAMSGAGTDTTAFSGMTAGTGFTLGSGTTQGSGFSRAQEQLADSVLSASGLLEAAGGGSTVVPVAAAEAADVTASSAQAAGMGESSANAAPACCSISSSQIDLSNSGVFASTAGDALQQVGNAGASGSSSMSGSAFAAASEQPPLDTSLYASIIAHSDDSPAADGSPGGSSQYDFQQSFAAALSAVGLDALAGPTAPSASMDSGSEDWLIVDGAAEDAEGQQQHEARQ